MAGGARFLGSAKLIAFCTLGSRITGLARDITLNYVYGQRWVQDAFNYGFLLPNLFRRLFGEGALAAVFIPVFTDVLETKDRSAAWLLLGRVTGLMALVLVILTIALELVLFAIWQVAPGGAMRQLQIALSAVMMPFMITVCLLALFSSILNCLDHFAAPALLPVVLNLFIIFGALAVGPWIGAALEKQIYGVAIAVVVAGVVQLFMLMPVLRRHGVRFRLSLHTRDPELRQILRMFLPILLGQGVLLFNVFFDAQICTFLTRGPEAPATFNMFGKSVAYPLEEGALSAVNNAQRLYQFPLGVLAISLATAAFPAFSRCASRHDWDGLRGAIGQSLRVAIFEGLPSGIVLIVLAEPIVSLLFEHGRFGPEQTVRAAAVLRWYGIGMAAYCGQHILLRGFYSLKDTLTPMWISCFLVALNIVLNLTLIWSLREQVFGLTTATTATLHLVISVWLLRRRLHGRMGGRAVAGSLLRAVAAAAAAGASAWWLLDLLRNTDLPLDGLALRAVHVFAPLITAGIVYLLVALTLRMPEVSWLLRRSRSPLAGTADL